MTTEQNKLPNILFLFSDTGGGHRSSVNAIIEALELEFPGRLTTEMVDFLKEYTAPPLREAPKIYPKFSRFQALWKMGYIMSDGKYRSSLVTHSAVPYFFPSIYMLINDHPADLVVSVHPFMNTTIRRAIHYYHIPFATVITDMVSVHAFWFDKKADLILVPTEEGRQRGIELGVPEENIKVCGQPVAEKFSHLRTDKMVLRQELGWDDKSPTVLLVGGGEGMGPLEETALAINRSGLDLSLVIVAGRNQKLKDRLEQVDWQIPCKIYGFVENMPDLMSAADILITKAGPGTISEAFIAGLPIILYSRMPGQEEGNVLYVVGEQAGVWAPTPETVVNTLKRWTQNPAELAAVKASCLRLAKPDSTRQIARELAKLIGIS